MTQHPAVRSLHVFFDVDYTLIAWDGALRSHARYVFEQLHAGGHSIHVWSGAGIRRRDMEHFDLDRFVTGYYVKPLNEHRARLQAHGVPVVPDFVIDDHIAVVMAFGGYHIPREHLPNDTELLAAMDAIDALARRPARRVDAVRVVDAAPALVGEIAEAAVDEGSGGTQGPLRNGASSV